MTDPMTESEWFHSQIGRLTAGLSTLYARVERLEANALSEVAIDPGVRSCHTCRFVLRDYWGPGHDKCNRFDIPTSSARWAAALCAMDGTGGWAPMPGSETAESKDKKDAPDDIGDLIRGAIP